MSNAYPLLSLNPSSQSFPTGIGLNATIQVCSGHLAVGSSTLTVYTDTQFNLVNISVDFLGYTVTGSVSLLYNSGPDNWTVTVNININGSPQNQTFTAIPQPIPNWNGDAPSIQFTQVDANNNLIPSGLYIDIGTYTSWAYDDKIQFQASWVSGCPVIGLDAG